jgi:phage baseplate assembly protein W
MGDQRHLLKDLRLQLRRARLRPVYEVKTSVERIPSTQPPRRVLEFGTIEGEENLAQAIVVRLLTPKGELEELAHPDYGSRLHELIGRPNTPERRDLVKLYTLESLNAEPRIANVVSVVVSEVPAQPARVDVHIEVQPVGRTDIVSIGPLELELAP